MTLGGGGSLESTATGKTVKMLACVILGSCLMIMWIYFLWSRRRFYKAAWQLRGPIGLPFIGMGPQMMNPETFLQYMEQISQQYRSPFISWMGTKCILYVSDPVTAEKVFNSKHCTNKGDFYNFISSAIGDGLFTASDPRWHKHRRLINPAFGRQILNSYLPIFNEEASFFITQLHNEGVVQGKALEIYEILKKTVLEAACRTTMGKKMNFPHNGSAAIFEAYNGITQVCVQRMLSPWYYPDIIYRCSQLYVKQQKVIGVLFGFVEQLLEQGGIRKGATSKQNPDVHDEGGVEEQGTSASPDKTRRKSKAIFIEQMREHVERGQVSWQDVRDEANVTIAATFETTSTALYFTILCLAIHPECQDKLYNELVTHLPTGEVSTVEQLDSLTYTEMVINEAMRLFAPVPMVLRRAEDDLELQHTGTQITVPRGTQIGIDIYNMHRDMRIWGPLARTYNPDVHFGAEAQSHHPFAFVPFTKGLRMCIGYRYALLLMKLLIAKLFRHYRITTAVTMDQLIIKGTISLKLREYPMCSVHLR